MKSFGSGPSHEGTRTRGPEFYTEFLFNNEHTDSARLQISSDEQQQTADGEPHERKYFGSGPTRRQNPRSSLPVQVLNLVPEKYPASSTTTTLS
jgi:hypothetical protein